MDVNLYGMDFTVGLIDFYIDLDFLHVRNTASN